MKQHIPNAITLLNLFCGCCAAVSVLYGHPGLAVALVAAGVFLDYWDGAVARWLHVHSPLGKELDSLADMVTFGVVPGAMLYTMLSGGSVMENMGQIQWAALPAFILTAFSGLRLAKFNLDPRQADHFLGLPTPSCTIFVSGLLLTFQANTFGLGSLVGHPVFLYACIAGLSFLLVSELPMFNLKMKVVRWKGNEIKFIFGIVSLLLLGVLREAAPAAIILFYILLNIARWGLNPTTSGS